MIVHQEALQGVPGVHQDLLLRGVRGHLHQEIQELLQERVQEVLVLIMVDTITFSMMIEGRDESRIFGIVTLKKQRCLYKGAQIELFPNLEKPCLNTFLLKTKQREEPNFLLLIKDL